MANKSSFTSSFKLADPKTSETEAIRFWKKFLLLLTPFIVLTVVEVFVLPIDFFMFRCWESLMNERMEKVMPGPFYPWAHLSKLERGDLAPYTPYAIKKPTIWETDRYGYRTIDKPNQFPEIVMVGDSYTVGSGLTQKETLSEVLSSKLGIWAYPYATKYLNDYLKEKRFEEHPPKTVLFVQVEWVIKNKLAAPIHGIPPSRFAFLKQEKSAFIDKLIELVDRSCKHAMFRYARSRVTDWYVKRDLQVFTHNGRTLLFMAGAEANRKVPEAYINDYAKTLKEYAEVFRQKGIRFIFVPIPNKETIYYDFLPDPHKPTFLTELMALTQKEGIETVNLLPAFEASAKNTPEFLYFPDDSHWNSNGVNIAADLIAAALKPKKS